MNCMFILKLEFLRHKSRLLNTRIIVERATFGKHKDILKSMLPGCLKQHRWTKCDASVIMNGSKTLTFTREFHQSANCTEGHCQIDLVTLLRKHGQCCSYDKILCWWQQITNRGICNFHLVCFHSSTAQCLLLRRPFHTFCCPICSNFRIRLFVEWNTACIYF